MTTDDITGAGRSPQPSPLPPRQPSFARRQPFLAAFGTLAALSLFSSFWPASAVITAVVVAARATGADRRAWQLSQRGVRWLAARIRSRKRSGPPSPQPGGRTEAQPTAAQVGSPEAAGAPGQDCVAKASRGPAHDRERAAAARHARRQAPQPRERDVAGRGL